MAGKTKILIAEHNTPLATMMVHLLTRARCAVETAWRAEQILPFAQSGQFDLIVLDVDFPEMDGLEICYRLKADTRLNLPPLFFVSDRPHVEVSRRVGAVGHIIKSFEVSDFIFRVFSLLKFRNEAAAVFLQEANA